MIDDTLRNRSWPAIAWWLAVAIAACVVAPVEWTRLQDAASGPGGVLAWLFDWNVDTTPFAIWLLLLPLAWFVRRPLFSLGERSVAALGPSARPVAEVPFLGVAWCCAILVAGIAFGMHAWVGGWFGDLPPAFHDEFSYLLQARTFLAGRWAFPSHAAMPELFDQYHVLNEGRFASRYFPATGAWIAPFLAVGRPYLGHWIAGSLAAMFVFWSGRELGGNGVGLLAGLVMALSPGLALFGNLLLAHHPTLLGLTAFTYFFLRLRRTGSTLDAGLAGFGLTFAMLARPMTAFGFSLPFGLLFALWLLRGTGPFARPGTSRHRAVAGFAVPLALGFALLGWSNHAITGHILVSPYQQYTETYTPRHVYGFDNVTRGERHLGPKVLDEYDRWAENLDADLALRNVQNRWLASWQWTLGLVPLLIATLVFVLLPRDRDPAWWLVPAAIVSLHAVHVPYWYDGILHFHYLFETLPLWALLLAAATSSLFRAWHEAERPWMPLWWGGFVVTSVLVNLVPVPPFWSTTRLENEMENERLVRETYAAVAHVVESNVSQPALVLVRRTAGNPHMDYVVNDPALRDPILYGRRRADDPPSEAELVTAFPDRSLYRVDVHEVFTPWDAEAVPPPEPGFRRFVMPSVVVDVRPLIEGD